MGIYTDLAAEAREMNPDMNGIEEEESQEGEVLIKRIRITSEEAASRLGKKQGMYITLDAPELETRSPELFASVAGLIGKEINRLLDWDMSSATVLVVGLGNSGVTPDSLGPEVVNRIHITRHIKIHARSLCFADCKRLRDRSGCPRHNGCRNDGCSKGSCGCSTPRRRNSG